MKQQKAKKMTGNKTEAKTASTVNAPCYSSKSVVTNEDCMDIMKSLPVRLRAVWCCFWFAFVPWQLYERKCHYTGMSYWEHVRLNFWMAITWITGKESQDDWEFEHETNPSWSIVCRNMFLQNDRE